MKQIILIFLGLQISFNAGAYDCSKHTQFTPISYQETSVYVGHFSWQQTEHGKEEVVEDVCSSNTPLKVPVLDIRGREEEWFYCNQDTPPTDFRVHKYLSRCAHGHPNQTSDSYPVLAKVSGPRFPFSCLHHP